MKINWRIGRLALFGGLLLIWPAIFDYWKFNFFAEHPETFDTLKNITSFVAVAYFFSVFFRERASSKQEKIYTVAYRSLSQASNDVARKLIAPLNGADLYELGLYKYDSEQWDRNRKRLKKLKLKPPVFEGEAIFDINDPYFAKALKRFINDDEGRREYYVIIARARRDIQNTIGIWSPVMFTSSGLENDLGQFRKICDDLEELQELWRKITFKKGSPKQFESAELKFWVTVRNCKRATEKFGNKGKLPSRKAELWDDAEFE